VRKFSEGDLVLRRTEANMQSKLAARWRGPYRIHVVIRKGVYQLNTLDGGNIPRTWNIANLQFYYI